LTVADGAASTRPPVRDGVLGVLNLGTVGSPARSYPTITNDGQIVANFTDTSILAAILTAAAR